MLNFFIRIVRLPIAIVGSLIVSIIMFSAFLLECPIALVWLVLLSIFAGRDGIDDSWVASYPNSIRKITAIISNVYIWFWVTDSTALYNDIEGPTVKSSIAGLVFNGLALLLIVGLLITVFEVWAMVGGIIKVIIGIAIGIGILAYALKNA